LIFNKTIIMNYVSSSHNPIKLNGMHL